MDQLRRYYQETRRRDKLIVSAHEAGLNNSEIAALMGVARPIVIKVVREAFGDGEA